MKRIYYLLVSTLLFAAGCTNDFDDRLNVPLSDMTTINIEGRISQSYTTRVDDGGFCTGDQIGLFGVNYTDNNNIAGTLLDDGNQVDNARYTFNAEEWSWTSSGGVYYKDSKTNIDLYGYYPYGTVKSVSEYAFEVAKDQSGNNSVDGYAQSDFLWGKATNIAPTEQKIKILFNHKMACANVVLVEGANFVDGEFASLKKSVLVMNTSRKSTIDLATGVVSATGEVESEGIVMKSNEEGYKAIVVPQTVTAGTSLFSITVDGIAYRFKKDVDFTYEQGKQAKFTIEVSKKVPSGDYEFSLVNCDIIDWIADIDTHGGEARQYYVVYQEEPGTLEQKLTEANKDPNKIKNLKVSGKINAVDFEFMNHSMAILQAVNLKDCEVCANNVNPKNAANEIPRSAFSNKTSLVYFTFPKNITHIDINAFYGCSNLSGALIIPDGVTEIKDGAFHNCSNLTSLQLPSNLKVLDGFLGCTSLSGTLNIPSSVVRIENHAFSDCSGLTGQLNFPENLEYIGCAAFYGCKGLTGSITIPPKVEVIDGGTFAFCSGLTGNLTLHDNLKFSLDKYQRYGDHGPFEGCNFTGELILPANLTEIPENCFKSCKFSSIGSFPEGLLDIGKGAFQDCWRLYGILEFPESLVSIGDYAFRGCSTLEGIILPSELGVIKANTFSYCYYINKITCKAIEPPTILSGAFDGVAKDNFTVEVPEQSVNRYQNDTKWGEFKRIGAYNDFSISCREMRVLNAEHSRELVLRAPAGLEWSIESKPDWVTITPSSGIGKQNVVITVNEMAAADVATFEINTGAYNSPNYETHNGRAGEIVFLLNDKDYHTTMSVEQYDCDNYDGEVIVNQTASEGNGVNIVFMGDCFDARDIAMGRYLDGINEAIGYYFDIEPYKTYKSYFNIYTVVGMSNDSGMGTVNTIRDAKFGSQYLQDGISPNHETCYEYATKASTVNEDNIGQTLVVMIENTTEYGGICYMWGDGSAIACCPMSADAYPYDFRGIVQHEAGGHGFGKLADEYIYFNSWLTTCLCYGSFLSGKALGWYRNLEDFGDMDKVSWSHLIFHPKYSNIVDVYEGGYTHTRGCFRSEPNSCMNNNIPYFSAISRQEIVERIMKYAGKEFDINEFYANDVLDSQGNNTGATRSSVEETSITLTGAGKQMPPKFMGDKPQLTKSNK